MLELVRGYEPWFTRAILEDDQRVIDSMAWDWYVDWCRREGTWERSTLEVHRGVFESLRCDPKLVEEIEVGLVGFWVKSEPTPQLNSVAFAKSPVAPDGEIPLLKMPGTSEFVQRTWSNDLAREHEPFDEYLLGVQRSIPLPVFPPWEPGSHTAYWFKDHVFIAPRSLDEEEFVILAKAEILREEERCARAAQHELDLKEQALLEAQQILAGGSLLIGERSGPARPRIPAEVQRFVWKRDSGRCTNCDSQDRLEFDHIIPLSQGGSNTTRNLQLLCEPCNRRKGARIGGID